jgi:predicted ATP-dependent serine protease
MMAAGVGINAAAISVLASDEISIQLQRKQNRQTIGTRCNAIDEALRGGIESGQLTCISGDRETGKSTVLKLLFYSFEVV